MSGQLTQRQRRFAERADIKLVADGVAAWDYDAVRECLLGCVAGRLLWRAWKMREDVERYTTRQLSLDAQPRMDQL